MPYNIIIRLLATTEIIEAFDWYETQRAGLGNEFLDELDSFYERLRRNPLTYSYYEKPVRQGKLKRFPYLVIYEVIQKEIVIYSVFMSKREPGQKRTK